MHPFSTRHGTGSRATPQRYTNQHSQTRQTNTKAILYKQIAVKTRQNLFYLKTVGFCTKSKSS